MRASFVDLRRKSSEIIKALGRNERITVLYRGKPAAVMHPIGAGDGPAGDGSGDTAGAGVSARDHAAFGIWADRAGGDRSGEAADVTDVAGHIRKLRRGRHDAL